MPYWLNGHFAEVAAWWWLGTKAYIWFELLDATITNYGIEEDCIFSMDETCGFLDKLRTKGCHIGPAKQVWQMILRNEASSIDTQTSRLTQGKYQLRHAVLLAQRLTLLAQRLCITSSETHTTLVSLYQPCRVWRRT